MKTSLRKCTALLLCLCAIFLSGCWDQKIFEQIGFLLQLGVETDNTGKIIMSGTLPVVSEEIEKKVEVLSASIDLIRDGRGKFRSKTGKTVEAGKIQMIHFSRELAEKGISEFLDLQLRSPENPLLANIVIVDGSPKQMFEMGSKYKDKPRLAFYIVTLLQEARRSAFAPEMRVYRFQILSFSETIDPIAPILIYNENEVELKGCALFDGDRMVGEIDRTEAALLQAMMGVKINSTYIYKPKPEAGYGISGNAAVKISGVKRKIRMNMEVKPPKIDISLDMSGVLQEYPKAHAMNDPEVKKKLEEEVETAIREDCEKILKYLQSVNADPIGFGEMVRAKENRFYKSAKWNEIYKNISLSIDVKMKFEHSGAIY